MQVKGYSKHTFLFLTFLSTKVFLAMPKVADHLSCTDNAGNTPLHIAVECNYVEAVDLLLAKDAVCDHKNNLGRTPLHLAAKKGYDA